MAATQSPTLALPSAGGERPRNVLTLASLLLGAGGLMFQAALIGAYVHLRGRIDHWPPEEAHLYLGNMLVITILLSAVTVEWGHAAVRRNLVRQASAAYGITAGFGVAFLTLLSHTMDRAGYGAAADEYATVVSALAFVLGILVVVAIGAVLLTLFRVRGGQVTAADPDQARAVAWYWHFTVVAAVATWYTVVVLK
jgi:heme/copper-type cytochrome/quinol oxidase subunit 3